MGTVLVGMATIDQFEASLSAVLKGPTAWSAPLRVDKIKLAF
jgi:hypothetical protein